MTPRIESEKLITFSTAAKQLKISRQAVWDAVDKGRLKSVEIDGVPFVTKESVKRYKKNRRPGGPKPKHKA